MKKPMWTIASLPPAGPIERWALTPDPHPSFRSFQVLVSYDQHRWACSEHLSHDAGFRCTHIRAVRAARQEGT
jgi:hypothetical protein